MAGITGAIVAGVAGAGATAYAANRQSSAARDAARQQARGVESAQQQTMAATDRARSALMGGGQYYGQPQMGPQQFQSNPLAQLGPGAMPANQFAPQQNQMMFPDPRQDYMQGIQSGLQFTNQGFGQAIDTLNPLAQLAQPYIDEQYNLLGMGGQQAQQQALSRVSDPLIQAQEQAFLRNNAQLGGVGGNVLAGLADQTRQRTEANLGNRLAMLGSAASPALNSLQQLSNLRLNRGLSQAGILQGAGASLADMETNRRNALANIEIGQGAQMSQLAQNLGTAQAGGSAYAAQNAPALSQGLASGLSIWNAMGGPQQLQNNRIGNQAFNAIDSAGLF